MSVSRIDDRWPTVPTMTRIGLALSRLLAITGPNEPPGISTLAMAWERGHQADVIRAAADLQCLVVPHDIEPTRARPRDIHVAGWSTQTGTALARVIETFYRILIRWRVLFREGQVVAIGEVDGGTVIHPSPLWPPSGAFAWAPARLVILSPLSVGEAEYEGLCWSLKVILGALADAHGMPRPAADEEGSKGASDWIVTNKTKLHAALGVGSRYAGFLDRRAGAGELEYEAVPGRRLLRVRFADPQRHAEMKARLAPESKLKDR